MAAGYSESEARRRADSLGDVWIRNHQSILKAFPQKLNVRRWLEFEEEQCMRDAYFTQVGEFWGAMIRNGGFKKAVENDVTKHFRREKRLPSFL